MARPRKAVVDYFPHSVHHGKTMAILEQLWGNDGYAFWFKLLEHLGRTERHHIHWDDEIESSYFSAIANVSVDLAEEILNKLAQIGAIDKKLWGRGIIYCQNFVDGVGDAYKKRKMEIPSKSLFRDVSAPETPEIEEKPQDMEDNRRQKSAKESKVKERKVNKSKENKTQVEIPSFIKPDSLTAFQEMRKKIKKPLTDRASEMLIARLTKFHLQGHDVNDILDTSTMNCYQGVFEPKNKVGQQNNQQEETAEEFGRRVAL